MVRPLAYGLLIVVAAAALATDFIVINLGDDIPVVGDMAGIATFRGAYMVGRFGRGADT